jgi:hypothetical protein
VLGVRADGVFRFARRSLQVLLTALAAHAAAYGSFRPGDSRHGYLGIYELTVAALSAVAVGLFLVALVALLAGRGRMLGALVGARDRETSFARAVASLSCLAFGVLAVQESAERSAEMGVLVIAGAPGTIFVNAAVAVVLAATVFVLLERSCVELVEGLLTRRRELPRPPARLSRPRAVSRSRRRNSLADFRGLRAPPLAR